MTSQRRFPFSFPEGMDGYIYFLYVRSLFLNIRPSKTIEKLEIEILVYTPFVPWLILDR